MTDTRFDDPEHGIRFARIGLAAGAAMSIAGNVANVILTEAHYGVFWRIPGAVAWPSALFLAIEIIVRNRHRRQFTGYFARVLLMLVSVTTFVTSFVNLSDFMRKMNEPWIATLTGPIGIDGLMLGSTLMLLAASLKVAVSAPEHVFPVSAVEPEQMSTLTDADIWAGINERVGERPVSVRPSVPVVSGDVERSRSRSMSGEQISAVSMLMLNQPVSAVVSETGVSRATVQRMRIALSALMSNPQADVSAQKLNGALVEHMRKVVRS